VELAMLDEARAVGAEFNRIAGENCLYFETGQGSALSAGELRRRPGDDGGA
jgi:ethanolamine ammonia-lyase large subunit